MEPIDIHIAHLPGENPEWWQQCQQSLAGHPVNIHNLDGVQGDVYATRRRGYSLGCAPWVSFVDPDDIVLPGAFESCLRTLEQDSSLAGAYTSSDLIDYQGEITRLNYTGRAWRRRFTWHDPQVHQIVVMPRKWVQLVLARFPDPDPDLRLMADRMIFALMSTLGDFAWTGTTGYRWRVHDQGSHHHTRRWHGTVPAGHRDRLAGWFRQVIEQRKVPWI
jgi:hypothetical protein